MFRPGRARLRHLPINSLAPNILTTLALCSGLTSIRFSLLAQWELAVTFIVIAAILDSLDGRLARLLKGASRFGAELDSLADFLSFGVAPVILLYLWTLNGIGNLGWIAVLAFSVCCALRLARFNTALDDPDRPAWTGSFFTGVPAPAGAGLSLLPIMVSFELGDAFVRSPWLNAAWCLAVAFMMVSRLPTYSFKRIRVQREHVLPMLILVGLLAALLVSEPWKTLSVVGALYLVGLPLAFRAYARQRQAAAAPAPAEPPPYPAPEPEAPEHRLH